MSGLFSFGFLFCFVDFGGCCGLCIYNFERNSAGVDVTELENSLMNFLKIDVLCE